MCVRREYSLSVRALTLCECVYTPGRACVRLVCKARDRRVVFVFATRAQLAAHKPMDPKRMDVLKPKTCRIYMYARSICQTRVTVRQIR